MTADIASKFDVNLILLGTTIVEPGKILLYDHKPPFLVACPFGAIINTFLVSANSVKPAAF